MDFGIRNVGIHVALECDLGSEFDAGPIATVVAQAIQIGTERPDRPIGFGLKPALEVNLTLTTDDRIHQLNRDYRGQDRPTDVLSFSQIEGGPEFVAAPSGVLVLGDVVISVETAQRQAKSSVLDELRLLAVHGALHLLGYDHETDTDEARMNALTHEALQAG